MSDPNRIRCAVLTWVSGSGACPVNARHASVREPTTEERSRFPECRAVVLDGRYQIPLFVRETVEEARTAIERA